MCAMISSHKPYPYYTGKPTPGELGAYSSSHSNFRSQVGVGTQLLGTLGPCSCPVNRLIWSLTKNLDTPRPQSLAAGAHLSHDPLCNWLPGIPTRWKHLFKALQQQLSLLLPVESPGHPKGTSPTSSLVATLTQQRPFPFSVPMAIGVLPWFTLDIRKIVTILLQSVESTKVFPCRRRGK